MQVKDKNENILKILLSNGVISEKQKRKISREAKEKKESVSHILKEKNIPEKEILYALSVSYDLPKVNLKRVEIVKEALSYLPEKTARKKLLLPFDLVDNKLSLALAEPEVLAEKDLFERIRKKYNLELNFFLAPENQIKEKLSLYHTFKRKKEPKKIEVQKVRKEKTAAVKKRKRRDILDVLVLQEQIKPDKAMDLREEAEKKNLNLFSWLKQKGVVSEEILFKAYADSLSLPYVSLLGKEIPTAIITRFPKRIAEKYRIIIFDVIGEKVIKVATSAPEDPAVKEILDFVAKKNNIEIELSVASEESIETALKEYEKAEVKRREEEQRAIEEAETEKEAEVGKMTVDGKEEVKTEFPGEEEDLGKGKKKKKPALLALFKRDIKNVSQLEEIIRDGSVPAIVAGALNFALFRRASDIHFQPTKKNLRLRFRIDGVLYDIAEVPTSLHDAIIARIKILAKLRIDEKRIPQDGRFDLEIGKKSIDVRVSTYPTVKGEKAVLRILDKSRGIYNLEELGLGGKSFKIFKENIKKPYGIIIATGPTGSGKTTTLYAALSHINEPKVNIVTLEDPVEYEIDGVTQAQARPDIGFSFAEGLRSIVRQDPDIIMVGEIRDTETAALSIHAALTGHLVFSTLHTNDASGAIPRMIDMGIEPFLIISSVNLFLAQRLVRRVCPHCKKEDKTIPKDLKLRLEREIEAIPEGERKNFKKPYRFYKGKGCRQCTGGYSGRIGIFEILPMTEKIEELTVKRANSFAIKKAAMAEGMITLKQDGLLKALQGITSVEEVLRVTVS